MINLKHLFTNICETLNNLNLWKNSITPTLNACKDVNDSLVSKGVSTSAPVTLKTATYTNLLSLSLTPGIWMVWARVRFNKNNTGTRIVCIGPNSAASNTCSYRKNAVTGQYTYFTLCYVTNNSTTRNYYLAGYQNSGGDLAVSSATFTAQKLYS